MEKAANLLVPKTDGLAKVNVSLRIAYKRPSAEKVEQQLFATDAWALLLKHGSLLQKYFSDNKQCMDELKELCQAHGFFKINHQLKEGGAS